MRLPDAEPAPNRFRRGDRERPRPISQLPNLVTLLALACGLTAARVALGAVPSVPVILLFMLGAAAFDGIDGRLARLLSAESAMGAHLDSLSDAISFGVAPALIVYQLLLPATTDRITDSFTWLAAMVYVGAIVLRLARFNVLHDGPDRFPFDREFFVGLPAPVAAWFALLPVVCRQAFGPGWWSSPLIGSIWLILVAVLAFSRLPTFTFKTWPVPQRYIPVLLLAFFVAIAALIAFPYLTILVLLLIYLVHIPFAVRQRRFLISHPPAWEAATVERRQMRRQRRLELRQVRRHNRRVLGRRPGRTRRRRRADPEAPEAANRPRFRPSGRGRED
ncbi:MAG: phosphatidylcholine/phosphatidylserine synthase [Propionibacteriaceae bacterium]|nr:phosphatidylcholine/phosphatidylserine synthase [Propionibacteriaceae bacterium]